MIQMMKLLLLQALTRLKLKRLPKRRDLAEAEEEPRKMMSLSITLRSQLKLELGEEELECRKLLNLLKILFQKQVFKVVEEEE